MQLHDARGARRAGERHQAVAAQDQPTYRTVGAIVRKNLPLLVAEDSRLGQSLLGMNFMGTLAGFDVRGDRLVLRD